MLLRILPRGENQIARFLIERYFEIVSKFIHERQVSQFLSKLKGDIFVDVGAYIGYYSLMLRNNFRKIFAFEPFPSALRLLRQNVYYGKAKNINCLGIAVSDKDGTRTLYQSLTAFLGTLL